MRKGLFFVLAALLAPVVRAQQGVPSGAYGPGASGLPPGCTSTSLTSGQINCTGGFLDKSGTTVWNVQAYGASGSNQSVGITAGASGNATVTLSSAIDFQNGQGVWIPGGDVNNGNFCTTIVSGGGTTSLVLAAAPTNNPTGNSLYHDDGAAINAAHDAAFAATDPFGSSPTLGRGDVWFPPGIYNNHCAPIHHHFNRVRFVGANRTSVHLVSNQNWSYGPGYVASPGPVSSGGGQYLPTGYLGANLLTGGTQSFNVAAGGSSLYLDFRACGAQSNGGQLWCGEINGLGALTIEATINDTATPINVAYLCSSGVRDSVDGYRSALCLDTDASGHLQASLTTTSGSITITGSTVITTNANHHIAFSWDGSNARLYLDGSQQGSTTALSGTVVQGPFEVFRTGGDNNWFASGGTLNFNAQTGRIDGIRISNTARYTCTGASCFTPPSAKWPLPVADGNVMIQCNFTTQVDIFTVCHTGLGYSGGRGIAQYLPFFNSCSGLAADSTIISDVTFDFADGEYIIGGGQMGTVERVNTQFANHNGLMIGAGCAFDYTVKDLLTSGSGRYGLAVYAGIGDVQDVRESGDSAVVGMWFGALNTQYKNVFMGQRAAPTGVWANPVGGQVGAVFTTKGVSGSGISGTQDWGSVEGFETDTEAGDASVGQMVIIDNIGSFTWKGGVVECALANANCYPVTVQNSGSVSIDSVNMAPGANVTAIHTLASAANSAPVSIINSQTTGLVWSDLPCTTIETDTRFKTTLAGQTINSGRTPACGAVSNPGTASNLVEYQNDATTGTSANVVVKSIVGTPPAFITDTFQRSNQNLTSGGWATTPGYSSGLQIVSNKVEATATGVDNAAYYTSTTNFSSTNPWAEVKIGALSGKIDVFIRGTFNPGIPQEQNLACQADKTDNLLRLIYRIGGIIVQASQAYTFNANDTVRIEATQSTINCRLNGVLQPTLSVNNANFVTGGWSGMSINTSTIANDTILAFNAGYMNPPVVTNMTAADTHGAVGVCTINCGKTGKAFVATSGQVTVTSDNAVTAGDLLTVSSSLGGGVHDVPAGPYTGQVVARATQTSGLLTVVANQYNVTPSASGGTIATGNYRGGITWLNALGGEGTLVESSNDPWNCSSNTCSFLSPYLYGFNGSVPAGAVAFNTYMSTTNGAIGTATLQPTANICPGQTYTFPNGTSACSIAAYTRPTITTLTTNGVAPPTTSTAGPTVNAQLYLQEPNGSSFSPLTLVNGLNSNISVAAVGINPTFRITGPSGAYSIGGFNVTPGGNVDGQQLTVCNKVNGSAMTVIHGDSGTPVGNRINTTTNENVFIGAGPVCTGFRYSAADNVWIMLYPAISNIAWGGNGHNQIVTGSGTSIGTTTLCAVASCSQGEYVVNVYLDIITPCTTGGTYIVNLSYTDDSGAKTVPVNIQGAGTTPATGSLALNSASNFGQATQALWTTGAAEIDYSTTATACGTGGPMVGRLEYSINEVQ